MVVSSESFDLDLQPRRDGGLALQQGAQHRGRIKMMGVKSGK